MELNSKPLNSYGFKSLYFKAKCEREKRMTKFVFRNNLIWSLELEASWQKIHVWIQFSGYQFKFLHHKLSAAAEWGPEMKQCHKPCLLEAHDLVRRNRNNNNGMK